eukprot:CAMPEP_0168454870 /NCGR_PEP_ID=MMETSP0228-20121227/50446_1 /TAXON_ID=133427 /ORGANISM="Protoceratium reticulatum, Strain CCCM 535 (=CCMP 1889)" /LENGTH=52 /DNA_ID=CAMNT_0008469675 /DNA_START=139 /DNA_END=293 /DNA_ORIENTATION=-
MPQPQVEMAQALRNALDRGGDHTKSACTPESLPQRGTAPLAWTSEAREEGPA